MADTRLGIILSAKDQASAVVRGLRGQMTAFKKDAITGFGLGAGISVFNLAERAIKGVVTGLGDAFTAAHVLGSGVVTGKLRETLREKVLAAVKLGEDGARRFELPAKVVRGDGLSPSPNEA